jgi:hypothetical protein
MAKKAEVEQITPGEAIKRRTRAPEGETNRQRFVRVASVRLTAALDAIRLLGEMGASNVYEFTPTDVTKLIDKLNSAVSDASTKLTERKQAKTAATASLFD